MTVPSEAPLRELLDRSAIRDLLFRYARGVDRRDLALVASCFTPDATYEGSLGRGGIRTALAGLAEAMERYEGTMHFVGNQLIDLRGDEAASETYAVAFHRRTAGALFVVAVRYLDDLVRADGAWRIRRRVVTREWEREEEHAPPPAP
jgi:uncharacterized protein (TIGR02246 family)